MSASLSQVRRILPAVYGDQSLDFLSRN